MTKSTRILLALLGFTLAACTGNTSQQQTDTKPDTFMSGNGRKTSSSGYQSTGDVSLLEISLPGSVSNNTVNYDHITVYWNPKLRQPNCVAYELTATQVSMGDAPDAEKRSDYNFNRDTKVKNCPDWWEYKNTDFDRGHMAPAMDMKWNKDAMEQCFLMTNICPQNHKLNDGAWRHTEEAIHSWARKSKRLVIFTGPIFNGSLRYTGKHNNIAIPTGFFKVVYAPEQKRAIAFLHENKPARQSWTRYAVTIDSVESVTGINFLAALPDNIEDAVESRQDIRQWPTYTPKR